MQTVFDFVHEHPRYDGMIDGIAYNELERLLEFKGTVVVVNATQYIRHEHLYRFGEIAKRAYGEKKVRVIVTHHSIVTPEATYLFVRAEEEGYRIYSYERGPVVFINQY